MANLINDLVPSHISFVQFTSCVSTPYSFTMAQTDVLAGEQYLCRYLVHFLLGPFLYISHGDHEDHSVTLFSGSKQYILSNS